MKRTARAISPPGKPTIAGALAVGLRRRGRRPLRCLVTGGAGFIGSHLVEGLAARGDRVLVLDDLSTGRLSNLDAALASDGVEFAEGSVLDAHLVDECMRSVDACVHLAAAVGVQLVVEQPLDSVLLNVRGAETVLSSAADHARRAVFASTSEVYGKNGGSAPVDEDADRVLGSARKGRWGYALSKSLGEFLAYQLHRELGAQTIVVRLFNTVGPRQRGAYGMVLPRFVRQALRGEPLTVYGDGRQTRCFCHVADAVDGILRLLDEEAAVGGIFNIGTQEQVTIGDLARRVIELSGSESTVSLVPYEEAFGEGFEELGRRVPDTTALEARTGWRPAKTLDDAIYDVIAFERDIVSAAEAVA